MITAWPAAFGRLCVETQLLSESRPPLLPAAFGRLCVETVAFGFCGLVTGPAAFGRLCVETATWNSGVSYISSQPPSGGCVLKLALLITAGWYIYPAAFGRLCVETPQYVACAPELFQPPSGGCVLKQQYRQHD